MMTRLRMMGQAGKAVSYVFLGLNHTARFASNIARNVGNGISNKGLFDLELSADGGHVIKELKNQTGSQVIDMIEQMDNFGIHTITISKNHGVLNDNRK